MVCQRGSYKAYSVVPDLIKTNPHGLNTNGNSGFVLEHGGNSYAYENEIC